MKTLEQQWWLISTIHKVLTNKLEMVRIRKNRSRSIVFSLVQWETHSLIILTMLRKNLQSTKCLHTSATLSRPPSITCLRNKKLHFTYWITVSRSRSSLISGSASVSLGWQSSILVLVKMSNAYFLKEMTTSSSMMLLSTFTIRQRMFGKAE